MGANGKALRLAGITLDVTLRKEAEIRYQHLNESLEERVRERTREIRQQSRLIEQAREAILTRSWDGRILSWNQGAERIYGWTRDEAVGSCSSERLRTKLPCTMAEIEISLRDQGTWAGELIHHRRDGKRIVVESRWVLDRDDDGEGTVLEINSDITERRAAEEALRLSESTLKESQRLAELGSWEWDVATDRVTWSDELFRIAARPRARRGFVRRAPVALHARELHPARSGGSPDSGSRRALRARARADT